MSTENYNYRFTWFRNKLDEYVRSSKSMDEYTFRSAYEHDQSTVPFNYTLLSDIPGLYRSRLARDIKIKNLLYKMHKNNEIWLDEDRMWHRKEL